MHKPQMGKPLKYKKRLLTRRVKKEEVIIVSRRTQPAFLTKMKVEALARQDIPLQRVSSTWVREIGYHKKEKFAVMVTKKGYGYYIYCSFKVFNAWYHAHSKGTFFNYSVKGKYKIVRYR